MDITAHLGELQESEAQAFRAIVRLLKARPEATPPPALHDRIMAQLPPKRTRLSVMWWKWGAPIAASLVVFLALVGLLKLQIKTPGADDDLRWLAANQEADGTWDPAHHGGTEAFRPALTALAVLALHSHRMDTKNLSSNNANKTNKNDSRQFAQFDDKNIRVNSCNSMTITKGLTALAALQTEEGTFGGDSDQAQCYNLAMATYTLAVCDADNDTLSRAVACIMANQEPDGSWTYAKTHEGNAAVTAWMTRALASAEANGNAEAAIPLRKGLRWLRNNVRDDGRMAYHPTSAPSDTLTALSAHALIEAGKLFPDLKSLGIRMTDAINVQSSDTTDCYRDYAKIIAFESAGKTAPAENVRNQIRQRRDTRSQDQWRIAGGRLYTAALTTLCRVQ